MDQPMVSVVIPVYNAVRFLERTVQSVLNQTYQKLEIILVNDCSTDESLEMLRIFEKQDARIQIIDLPQNGGVANARNRGIAAASGKYIALLDSDDTWEPDKIQSQVKLIEKENGGICYCAFDLVDEKDQRLGRPILVPPETSCQEMLYNCVFNCCTALFRAELLKEHPFRLDQYHEDYVLWIELMSLPVKAVGVQKILSHNRQVGTSRSHNKLHAAKERWKIYREVFGFDRKKSVCIFLKYGFLGIKKYYT